MPAPYIIPTQAYADSVAAAAIDSLGVWRPATVIIDSIAADTVAGRIPHFVPIEVADSMRVQAMIDSIETHVVAIPEAGSAIGNAPQAMPPGYCHSTPLTALMMGMLIVAGINAAGIGRALKSYTHELWSVRRRHNAFDDEHTAPRAMAILLGLVFVVFAGVALYNLPGIPPVPSFGGATAAMALTGLYFLFQYTAYSVLAYTFADADSGRRWVRGYLATQAYAGLFLVVPALLLVYMPQWHDALVSASVIIYCGFHIIFIIKGLRIFYRNLTSIFYFILYLCGLEIIPALVLERLCMYLWAYTA